MAESPLKPPALGRGERLEHRYYINREIGDGAFATVYAATDAVTFDQVALKLLHANRRRLAARERRVLHQLGREDHPNIIRLLRYFTTSIPTGAPDLTHVLCFPLLQGTLLDEIRADRADAGRVGGLRPDKLEPGLRSIVAGMAFLESQRIVHLDLKPENILRAAGPPSRLVIADFGNASYDVANDVQYTAQTPWYRAPEICLPASYGAPVDLWSIGCIAYEMETGVALFRANRCTHLTFLHVRELGVPPPAFLDLAETTPRWFSKTADGEVQSLAKAWTKAPRSARPNPKSPELRTRLLLDALLQWLPGNRIRASQLLEWEALCQPPQPS